MLGYLSWTFTDATTTHITHWFCESMSVRGACYRALNRAETIAALPYDSLCRHLEAMLVLAKGGHARCVQRTVLPLAEGGGGVLLSMAASDNELAVTKIVTVHPNNSAIRLPVVQSEVNVICAVTGRRLMSLDGDVVTARRTAAVSALAVRRCRPHLGTRASPATLLIVGSGEQGRAHADAFQCLFCISATRMVARTPGATGADAYAASLRPEDVAWADIVVTATSSPTPVISPAAASALRSTSIVCAVGAFTAAMAEVPAALVERSHWVADNVAAVRVEGGDFLQANAAVDWCRVVELSSACEMPNDQPVVFKSVGNALWDLAAAHCVGDNTY